MTEPDASAVGCVGRLLIASRGAAGPGEVLLRIRGGTEAYIAWSEEPLAKDTTVLVVGARGARTVDIVPWSELPTLS